MKIKILGWLTVLLTMIFNLDASPYSLSLLKHFKQGFPLPSPLFVYEDADLPVLDYAEFGKMETDPATGNPYFHIRDMEGLKKKVGRGIFPNEEALAATARFIQVEAQGLLEGSHWKFLDSKNPEAAFYKWASAGEEPGVKAFFTAVILEKAGYIQAAIRAYHAVFVHFPGSACWGEEGNFVWYVAPAALASIRRLCREYPSLNLEFQGGDLQIENGGDTNLENDRVRVTPGKFVRKTLEEKMKEMPDLETLKIKTERGQGKVRLVQFENGHWQLRVEGKPFWVQGLTYGPTRIGTGPKSDPFFHVRWMREDLNSNGIPDAPLEAWVDGNKNGIQDGDEKNIGDFQILKNMGCNAIRIYNKPKGPGVYDPSIWNKPLLREMVGKYGIRMILGDFIGAYTVGSGATWQEGTDYTNPVQLENMKKIVRALVLDLKSEPFVLMWLLGNENNMGGDYTGVNATRTNACKYPEAYARFLNELAGMIHELDPVHPVAVGNLGTGFQEVYARLAPQIDIFGVNEYMGGNGFGNVWQEVKTHFDRPVLVTEYGCDAYHEGPEGSGENETEQKKYLEGCFRDLVFHQAGGLDPGNDVGGVAFEYLDEWWKDTHSGDPESAQQIKPQFRMPFPDGWDHEEWMGVVSQGSGKHSPLERRLREAYFYFQEFWNFGKKD